MLGCIAMHENNGQVSGENCIIMKGEILMEYSGSFKIEFPGHFLHQSRMKFGIRNFPFYVGILGSCGDLFTIST